MQSNKNILRSGIWSYVENGSSQLFSLLTFLFIARMVGPAEFGTVAIASAWSALFISFTEAGIGDAIVQKNDRDNRYISTAFWLNLMLALVGTILVLIVTFTVQLSDNPKISQYLAVLAIGIPVSALGNIPTSLLRAGMQNKDLARRGILSDIAGCVVGILCAKAGWGGWAIIIQGLLSNSVKTIVVWKCSRWIPTREFDRSYAKGILQFGYKSLGAGILSSISARTDRFVMGFFFSARDVGIYSIASEGITRLSAVLITGLAQVMFPHYSSLQHDREKLATAFYKSLSWCCFVGGGAFAGLYILSPLLTSGILGHKWDNSIPILQILTLLGVMQCTLIVPMTLYKSVGKPGLSLVHAFLQVVMNIALIAIFKSHGLTTIALVLALRPLATMAIHMLTTNLILPNTKLRFLGALAPGLLLYGGAWLINTTLTPLLHSHMLIVGIGIAAILLVMALRVKNEFSLIKS